MNHVLCTRLVTRGYCGQSLLPGDATIVHDHCCELLYGYGKTDGK